MPIMLFLLSAFLFVYIELSLLVWVGSQAGILGLILLLALSFVAGLAMLRVRGWYTLVNVQKQLRNGEIPAQSLLKSGVWIVAGILLIIPGFLTDLLAVLLLLPPVRLFMQEVFKKRFHIFGSKIFQKSDRTFYEYQRYERDDGTIFEAEYEKQTYEDKRIK